VLLGGVRERKKKKKKKEGRWDPVNKGSADDRRQWKYRARLRLNVVEKRPSSQIGNNS
jgi:hypothetical protein